ncbi:MAG: hypothetical protein JJT90_12230 [Ectothiorhodospiraceae bacterium]|nr:hypothetical protein [Ectothiorhodospiraceae bacterium]
MNLPTLIRVDRPARLRSLGWLDDALVNALGGAIQRAKTQLDSQGIATAGVVHSPRFVWTGLGASEVGGVVRTTVEGRVRRIIDSTATAASIHGPGAPAAGPAASARRWRVLESLNLRMRVRDYLDYLVQVDPELNYEHIFLDVLHEFRWCHVWVVRVDVAMEAAALYPEVVGRMDALDPLPRGQTGVWTATPRERDRRTLIRLDRQHLIVGGTPELEPNNHGRVVGGGYQALMLPGARLLFTRMKLPELPSIRFGAGGEDAFWEALRRSLLEGDQSNRRATIRLLVELRRWPPALALLHEGMAVGASMGDLNRLSIRVDIVSALAEDPNRPYSVGLLLLHGVDHPIDHTPHGVFRDWFKQRNGRDCLAFLERVLLEGTPAQETQAARVVLHLLDFAGTVEAVPYRRAIAALRALARRQDLFSGGPLGEESLRQRIAAQTDGLLAQIHVLDRTLVGSPFLDPHRDQDRTRLTGFREALEAFKDALPGLHLNELEQARARIDGIVLGASEVQERVDGIHSAIRQIRTFLGSSSAESDETTVLFKLRSRYVVAVSQALTVADFDHALREVNIEGNNFAGTVAEYKFRRAHRDYRQAVVDIHGNRTLETFSGAGPVQEPAFYAMRRHLRQEMARLERLFVPGSDLTGGRGPVAVRVIGPSGRAEALGHPQDLNHAVDTETRVAVFRIRSAMFADLSIALLLENQIVEHSIGSAAFRGRQQTILSRIRREIVDAWNDSTFQEYIDKSSDYGRTFEQIQLDIRAAVRRTIAIELLITAVAAVLSLGVGLVVRAALVGRTVALVRTARAVETTVFLSEVGVFTATQLSGERLAFGRPITLGRTAEATITNLAFLGGFRVLGRLTGPLLERGGWGFVAAHSINAATLTGVGALLTKVQTGRWPENIGQFLVLSIGSYLTLAGAVSATRALLHPRLAPVMEARLQRSVERLDDSTNALLVEYRLAVRDGRLTERQFNRIRQGLRDNVAEAREIAKQLRNAGLRTREEYRRYEEGLNQLDALLAAAEFTAPRAYLLTQGGQRVVLALPAPENLPGVVRHGETAIFRYNALRPAPEIEHALTRYAEAGYGIQRLAGGLIRVTRSDGRLDFVLDPAPLTLPPGPEPIALITAGSGTTRPLTIVERAMGRGYLDTAATQVVEQRLATIHPRLLETLGAEFPEHTVLLSLRVFTQQHPQPWVRWRLDSVRGVATMLQTQRAVPLRAVLRMFESRTSTELNETFGRYHAIADRPGANLLVREDLRPGTSLDLIRAYDAIRRARLQLPDDMNRQAIHGLIRWIRDGRNVVDELSRIPLDQRRGRLEADSAIRDPRIVPTSRIQQILQQHSAPIRPGLDLFAGSPTEAAAAIEAYGQGRGGSLGDANIRTELGNLIRRYRIRVSDFQAGRDVERIMVGEREEIHTVLVALELGTEVFSLGNIYNLSINPAHYPLSRGYRVTGAPSRVTVQLDVGARRTSGRFLIIEATTGDISLPREWAGLDPESGQPANGTVNWNALDESNASHRKWAQAVKLRAAARFAHELGEAWGRTTIEVPELVIRVGRASAPARRALEAMGYRVVESNPVP